MSKAPADLRSLARSHTETAIRVLAGIAHSTKAPAAARVSAACALLDRGWGKAAQLHQGDAEGPIIVKIIQKVREPKSAAMVEQLDVCEELRAIKPWGAD
jgi:hypothetical protein